MQRRAAGFEKVAFASTTMELAPGAAVRVTVGAAMVWSPTQVTQWGHSTCFPGYTNYPQAGGTYMDPPALSRALEWTNTLRNRCSHISGLLGKTFPSLRALMQSALPVVITTAASGALSLRRLGGSW